MKVGRGRGGECAGTDIIERVYLPIWSRILKYFRNFYRPQRSWSQVMFLHVSVILLTGGWCLPQLHAGIHPPPGRHQEDTPSPQEHTKKTPPQEDAPRSSACWEKRATSGWYASYWNVYLLNIHLKCRLRVNPK